MLQHKLWFMIPTHTCGHTVPIPMFSRAPPEVSHTLHPLSLVVICSRSWLYMWDHLFQADTYQFQPLLPSLSYTAPLQQKKCDFAPFMSHKVNLIITDKPCRVHMTYLQPGKGIVMNFKVKVYVQINVVNLSSPRRGPDTLVLSLSGSHLSSGEADPWQPSPSTSP